MATNGEMRLLLEEQLRAAKRLRKRVAELERARSAPLAVVGMALRLPGGITTPRRYWEFLLSEDSALSEIPADRTGLSAVYDPGEGVPGRSYVNRAGFLDDIAEFDAGFFGISPREASAMDPQQRLLLETAWEAMERAGIPVRRGERNDVGVFLGIMASDYVDRLSDGGDRDGVGPYYGTGGGHSMPAGRISYTMGFSGPAISVDTACSSSLVALHLAAQSLRREECRYALVGGANLLISPDVMVSLCQGRALAPDGRSKSFTAAADGFGRGEGVGMLALMRLDEARREGRPVLAVVRGSAVNSDGASSGLTVPNGPAQQEVLRRALADAALDPAEVGWVEAHGTGTSLGDPIEVGALEAVMGGRSAEDEPLRIGSVKSRIGHLEAAAGIAGLLKAVLALRNGVIPSALGEDEELNPLIPWSRTSIDVPRAALAWPASYTRRIAGVSGFGMSGTNAHVLLEAVDRAEEEERERPPAPELLTISAKNPVSLKRLADEMCGYLEGLDPAEFSSVAHTARAGRAHFTHRIAVVAATPGEAARELSAAARAYEGTDTARVLEPVLRVSPHKVEPGLAALAAASPALGVGQEGQATDPEASWGRILRGLGIRGKAISAPQRPDGVLACLEWGESSYPVHLADRPEDTPMLLHRALAALYTAGAELRLDGLRRHEARITEDLPTYAFHRKRFWIDEPVGGRGAEPSGGAREKQERARGAEPSGTRPDPSAKADVEAFLTARLVEYLQVDEEFDPSATFLDVGGDSFAAMQLSIAVEEHYLVEVPLEEFDLELPLAELFDRLGAHITGAAKERV